MVQILKIIESVDTYLCMNLNKIHWPISKVPLILVWVLVWGLR